MSTRRHLVLLPLTALVLALAVPSAWAGFTRSRTATSAAMTTTSIAAPVALTAVRCSVTGGTTVTWTISTTTFVTSQSITWGNSVGFTTPSGTEPVPARTTSSASFTGPTALNTHLRVTALFSNWTKASNTIAISSSVC